MPALCSLLAAQGAAKHAAHVQDKIESAAAATKESVTAINSKMARLEEEQRKVRGCARLAALWRRLPCLTGAACAQQGGACAAPEEAVGKECQGTRLPAAQ